VYASTSGNVEAVVEYVAAQWERQGWSVKLHRAEQTSIELLQANDTFLLATSTWEHGALNPFFTKLHQAMKDLDFSQKKAAFVGLGDRRYEPLLFCEGMEIVKRSWEKNHGQLWGTSLKINGEPYRQLELVVKPWAAEFMPNEGTATRPSGLKNLIGGIFNHA